MNLVSGSLGNYYYVHLILIPLLSPKEGVGLFFVRLTKILTKNIQRIRENSQFFVRKNTFKYFSLTINLTKNIQLNLTKILTKKDLQSGFFVREILTLTKKVRRGVFVE